MPITGRIPYVVTGIISFPFPSGVEFTLAADGTHHVMARGAGGQFLNWAAAETLTEQGTTISNTKFRADVAAELGLVDGGSGSEIIGALVRLSAFNAKNGIILGEDFDPVFGSYQVYGINYSLDSQGVTSIVGKYRYYDGSTLGFIGVSIGGSVGQWVIGDDLFHIGLFGNGFLGFTAQVVILPLVGADIILTPDSWASKRYNLPGAMAATLWWVTVNAGNSGNIIPLGNDQVAIWAYRTVFAGEPASVLYGTVLDYSGGAPGTNDGFNDISSLFGIPFADERLNFAGSGPTIFEDDCYGNPSFYFLPDGRIEIFFIRGYSDNDGWLGLRRFVCNADFTGMTSFPLIQIDLSSIAGLTFECGMAYRIDNNNVVFMIKEDAALTFMEVALALPAANKRRWMAEPGPIRSVA